MTTVRIHEGSLADFKADVIVNSTNAALFLRHGGISRSIVNSAGKKIQDECSKEYPNGICFGGVAITNGYKLKCKKVYHVALPEWDSQYADASQMLCLTVCECLKEAHKNKMASIAFTALGCGFLSYPHDQAAETVMQCVSTFEKETPRSTLKHVTFVIWNKGSDWKHIKQSFTQELRRHGNRQKSTPIANQKSLLPSMCRDDLLSTCIRESNQNACKKVLQCGHICGGYRNERVCLPCLQPGCTKVNQTSQEDCIICYTDHISAAPALVLRCGHIFHLHCAKRILQTRWFGLRINFNFTQCPVCKEPMQHTELKSLLDPLRALQDDVMRKAMMRLQYEGLEKSDTVTNPNSPYYNKPDIYAMERYCYYPCHKCKEPYFGGTAQCEGGAAAEEKVEEMICPQCSGPEIAQTCSIHGNDFIEYKCRYCCTVALFYCFGTTHFCKTCHNNIRKMQRMASDNTLPLCPVGYGGKQLNGGCPLGIQHVPNGTEYCLGCGLCSNLQTF